MHLVGLSDRVPIPPFAVGSRLSGFVSDATVARWIKKRNGKFIPEDRLNAALIAGGIVIPLATLAVGFTMQYWTTTAGLVVSLVLLIMAGIGVSELFTLKLYLKNEPQIYFALLANGCFDCM